MNYLTMKRQAVLHIEFHNMSRIDHKEIGNTDIAGIADTEDIVDTEDIIAGGRIEVAEKEHIAVVEEEHIAVAEEERIEVAEEEHIEEGHTEVHNIETPGTGNTVDNRLLEVLH